MDAGRAVRAPPGPSFPPIASLALIAALALGGCIHVPDRATGPLHDGTALAAFQRGATSKDEVLARLGAPSGEGETLFPAAPEGVREIWVYRDQAMHDARYDFGAITGDARDSTLLVFFRDNRFDGYLWTVDDGIFSAR